MAFLTLRLLLQIMVYDLMVDVFRRKGFVVV
jgi:hypothetical protein